MQLQATLTPTGGDPVKVTILSFLMATSDGNQQYVIAVIAYADGTIGTAQLAHLTLNRPFGIEL
jgi:hypothetical protein